MTIKMVFLDLEGTLLFNRETRTDGSLWGLIPLRLNEQAAQEDEVSYAKWERGEYTNYVHWCDESLVSFKKHGLTKKLFRELLAEATLRDGVKETVAALHKKGIITAIVSGGFQQQAAVLQVELNIKHALTAVQIYWNPDGTVAGWNTLPSDNAGKVDFMELMCREYKLTKAECAFVGNGKNDVAIAQQVGTSFAVNDAHPALKNVATHTLIEFTDILKHL